MVVLLLLSLMLVLSALVLKLLGKHAMDRPDSAAALGDMLRQIQ